MDVTNTHQATTALGPNPEEMGGILSKLSLESSVEDAVVQSVPENLEMYRRKLPEKHRKQDSNKWETLSSQ